MAKRKNPLEDVTERDLQEIEAVLYEMFYMLFKYLRGPREKAYANKKIAVDFIEKTVNPRLAKLGLIVSYSSLMFALVIQSRKGGPSGIVLSVRNTKPLKTTDNMRASFLKSCQYRVLNGHEPLPVVESPSSINFLDLIAEADFDVF